MTMAAGVKFPAEVFSRPIPKKIFKKVFAADDSVFGTDELRIPLKRAGYLERLIVKISGGYTVANAQLVFKPLAPFSLIKRVTFEPQGYQKVIDLHGWNAHYLSRVSSLWRPGKTGFEKTSEGLDASAGVNVPKSKFATAVGAQTYEMWFELPFTRSATDPTGALFIPHPNNTELVILPAALKTEVVTVAANLTVFGMTVEVWQVTYSRPPKDDTIVPFGRGKAVVITAEDREDVTVEGDTEITLPIGGKLLQSIHTVLVNGARDSANVETLTLDLDGVKVYDQLDRTIWDYLTLKKNDNFALPLGMIHFGQDEFVDHDGSAAKIAPDDKSALALSPSQGRWLHLDSIEDKAKVILAIKAGAGVVAADRVHSAFRRIRPIEVGV